MFESSLIALDQKKPSRRRLLSLPIAVGLHLVALATFTFAGYWHVERVPEPPSNDTYIIQAKLPELPAARIKRGSPAPTAPEKAQAVAPKSTEPVQPKDTPETLPVKPTAPSSGITLVDVLPTLGDPRGSDIGDPNGKVDGVDGVPFNGKGPDNGLREGIEPASNDPIRVTGAVTRPVFLGGSQPRYTEVARRAGVQGTVVVDAVIDEHGRVQNVQVLKALPMGLDQAAVDAVRTWTFKPATLANRPVKVFYTLTVNFTLQR
jgi:protein TonB